MHLNLLDTDPTSPLAATVGDLDYDYQAEMWVQISYTYEHTQNPARWVTTWELHDDLGLRARWERPDQDPGLPKLVHTESRFTGEWKVGT
jgi:hypothetical protein